MWCFRMHPAEGIPSAVDELPQAKLTQAKLNRMRLFIAAAEV